MRCWSTRPCPANAADTTCTSRCSPSPAGFATTMCAPGKAASRQRCTSCGFTMVPGYTRRMRRARRMQRGPVSMDDANPLDGREVARVSDVSDDHPSQRRARPREACSRATARAWMPRRRVALPVPQSGTPIAQMRFLMRTALLALPLLLHLTLVAPADATTANDICDANADPCVVKVVKNGVSVTSGSVLDFGARTLRLPPGAQLVVPGTGGN